ncbi:MAG: hypothetical protein WKG32_23050 [Gemmatimonadaceae bacterium]
MTAKEQVLRAVQALPSDATIDDAIDQLRRLARGEVPGPEAASADETADVNASGADRVGAWDLLGDLAGKLAAPSDWASEHDHYLYGSPKRSSAA